jgi:hypothetical protein
MVIPIDDPKKASLSQILTVPPTAMRISGHVSSTSLAQLEVQFTSILAYSPIPSFDLFNDFRSEVARNISGLRYRMDVYFACNHCQRLFTCKQQSKHIRLNRGDLPISLEVPRSSPAKISHFPDPGPVRTQTTEEWTWKHFSCVIFEWSNSYDTEYQPLSIWGRGTNKMCWIEKSEAWL